MDTASGVLDLSRDRSRSQQNDSQCGGNVDAGEHLLKQQKEFEQKIQSYSGDDPLEPRYNFITWIENNFPNRGLDNGLVTVLEQTLSLLKDNPRYKQDVRYVALLIKYTELQPNPLELFQCVYNQGRGTACAILYHAWASQCAKVKNDKLANEIYELGISNKAQPFEELKQVHLQFQLNVGRRMLGISEAAPNTPCREALKKLQINKQPMQVRGTKNDKNEDTCDKRLPSKTKIGLLDKENSSPVPKKFNQQTEKTTAQSCVAQFKGRIRTDKPDTFKCPVAHFDPDDPTKLVMYPKDKVYAVDNQEFQLEELIAMLYETQQRPRKFGNSGSSSTVKRTESAKKRLNKDNPVDDSENYNQDGAWSQHKGFTENFECPVAYFEPEDPSRIPMYPKDKVYAVEGKEFQLEELKAMEYEQRQNKSGGNSNTTISENSIKTPKQGTPQLQVSGEKVLHDSLLTNQSLTVATKEALNLVREMWHSPSPVSVKNFNVHSSSEKLESEPFKVPLPPKSGFSLYTDESSSAGQLPSTSKQQDHQLKPTKPFIPCDIENIPFDPKTGSILRNKLKEKGVGIAPVVHQDSEFVNDENELGVRRLINDEEEIGIVSHQKPRSVKKQPFMVRTDVTDTIETCVSVNRKDHGLLKTTTPLKTNFIEASCSTQVTTTTTSTRKSHFVIQCDDIATNQEGHPILGHQKHPLVSGMECADENQQLLITEEDEARRADPLILPYVSPVNDIPVLEDECKENEDPENFNFRRPERRELSGILQPSLNIPVEPLKFPNQDKEYDFINDTCNTKAFAFALPSSTPFTGQIRNFVPNAAAVNNDNTVTYCSYVASEEAPKQTVPNDLSVILEASKERYSSSSGSSSSGQTPYGPSRLKPVYTYSDIKEESVNDLEKSVSRLHLEENIDPFCPELLLKLLSHIKFPQKHHSIGYSRINHDAPILRENSSLTLGKEKYITEKELGKGSYARVIKATNKNQTVALKYQKPAFEWEYYIACEIRKRLATSTMKNGFIEINHAYIFNNASILETEWGKYGSLIQVVNAVKLSTGYPLKVTVATLLCAQLFSIVEHLHKCKIIHGDIKPDNFILHAVPTSDVSQLCVKLIDFGRSIDMTLLPEGTVFKTIVTTDGFQCNEMKENRPWTYQTDYYGLAGTAYCLLMGDYMKVIKRGGKWGLQKVLPRYMHRDVWQPIFEALLNIESCTILPDLSLMRSSLEELLMSLGRLVSDHLNSVANIIEGH